jgi:hypothetical protein
MACGLALDQQNCQLGCGLALDQGKFSATKTVVEHHVFFHCTSSIEIEKINDWYIYI